MSIYYVRTRRMRRFADAEIQNGRWFGAMLMRSERKTFKITQNLCQKLKNQTYVVGTVQASPNDIQTSVSRLVKLFCSNVFASCVIGGL